MRLGFFIVTLWGAHSGDVYPQVGHCSERLGNCREPLEYFGLSTAGVRRGLALQGYSAAGRCRQVDFGVGRGKETLGFSR